VSVKAVAVVIVLLQEGAAKCIIPFQQTGLRSEIDPLSVFKKMPMNVKKKKKKTINE